MDEDQHANSGPSNKSPNQVPQKQKKKPRGPTKGIKSMPGVPRIIEWDHLDRPTGKWATDYKNHIGEISRAKVSILIRTWEDVSQGIKDTLWEDVKVTGFILEIQLYISTCLFHVLKDFLVPFLFLSFRENFISQMKLRKKLS